MRSGYGQWAMGNGLGGAFGMPAHSPPLIAHSRSYRATACCRLLPPVLALVSILAVFTLPAAAQDDAVSDSTEIARRITADPGGIVQARFTWNDREPPAGEPERIQGFQITRVRLSLTSIYHDRAGRQRASVFVRAGADAGGSFVVEQAYVDLNLGRVMVRIGQLYYPLYSEMWPDPDQTLAADYSPTGFVFDPGATPGIMAQILPGRWRLSAITSAGLRAGYSQSGDQSRADWALAGYAEYRIAGKDWTGFDRASSPRGREWSVKAGLGANYQEGGKTGDTDSLNVFYAAADAQAVGPGWNVLGQLAFTHTEYGEGFGFQTGQSYNDLGFVVQGGVYASRHLQVFLRYDQSIPDGKPRNPTLDPFSGGTGANDFRTLTGGFSYYLIPGKQEKIEDVARKFVELYKSKNISSGWSIYQSITGTDLPLLVVAHAAKSESDYYSNRAKLKELIGEEGEKLSQEAQALVRKIEFKDGMGRPDLSYPGPDMPAAKRTR